MTDNGMGQFLETFIAEAEDIVISLEDNIIKIEENPDDKETINSIFRSAHTLKGSAGLLGLETMQNFCHIMEDLLEVVRSRENAVSEDLVTVILRAIDIIKGMNNNLKDGKNEDEGIDIEPTKKKLLELLKKLNDGEENPDESKDEPGRQSEENSQKKISYYYLYLNHDKDIFKTGLNPLMFIDDLRDIGTILEISCLSTDISIEDFDPETHYLKWEILFQTEKPVSEINNIFLFVADESTIEVKELTSREDFETTTINGTPVSDFISAENENKAENVSEEHETNQAEEKGGNEQDESTVKRKDLKETVSDNKENASKDEEKNEESQNNKNKTPGGGGSPAPHSSQHISFIRVNSEKLDHLFNIVSELVIAQAQLNQTSEKVKGQTGEFLRTVTDNIDKLSQQLQEQTMSLRMVDLGPTFTQFKRMVRDTAMEKSKKVNFVIKGQDTELDKNMIDKINDPLKHIIRNSVDHGIETTEKRRQAGKPETGTLELNAYVEGGNVIIKISDDGAGINKAKVLNKAVTNGLVKEGIEISDDEINNLIFHPGLSTAEKITDISGRGVGMDAVKTNIKEINGNVEIESVEGRGTTIRLILPLTLAILDGMLTKIGEAVYIIPTISILETLQTSTSKIKTVEERGEVVNYRGSYLPLIRLYKLFNIPEAVEDPTSGLLVVVSNSGRKAALLVDKIIDQQQVVMKSLQENFKTKDGIANATILGDGDVALIIDINGLLNKSLMS